MGKGNDKEIEDASKEIKKVEYRKRNTKKGKREKEQEQEY